MRRRTYNKNYIELDDGRRISLLNSSHVSALCSSTDYTSNITVNGVTFRKDKVVKVYIKNVQLFQSGRINDYFCCGFRNLASLTLPLVYSSIGHYFLADCFYYNQSIIFPSELTYIGDYFLDCLNVFNRPVDLPEGLLTIGRNFMSHCMNFNRYFKLPSTLNSVGMSFMFDSRSFRGPLDLGSLPASVIAADWSVEYLQGSTLGYTTTSAPAYTNGVVVVGDDAGGFLSRFPNSTSVYYRKLLLG